MELLESGLLRAIGETPSGDNVLATSQDGGRTWSSQAVPTVGGWVLQNETHLLILENLLGTGVSPPIRVTVSSDSGATWTVLEGEDVPFGYSQCLVAMDGPMLATAQGRLWISTDESWLRYEELTQAPELGCLSANGDTITATGTDQKSAYLSTDLDRTWEKVDPR